MKIFSKILRAIVITLVIVLLLPFCFTIIKMLLEGDEGAITVLSVCLSFVLSTYINVIVHEGGHLVFGLLCGYRFSSFRVGSIMMIKQGGRMRLRSYSLAGTDGQCLMIPPSRESTKAEMILYNMGGVIFNIILVILCLGLNFIVPETFILTDTIRICCIISALLVLTNGIPLNMGGIANDGMNALHLSKNPVAAESFRKTLTINAAVAEGIKTSDMPDEWFTLPNGADMQNPHNVALTVFAAGRPFDKGDISAVETATEELLNSDYNIIGLYRNMLTLDLIYCRLVNGSGEVEHYLTAPIKKFMKTMKNFPSVIRTEYAIALLINRDERAASRILSAFEKNAHKYPYQQEIDTERMLMRKALEMFENNT